jgi:hypothetical protein
MKTFRLLIAAMFLTCVASLASAYSLTIDGATCGSCEGANLYLEINDNGGSFDVTLTVNTDNYTGTKDGLVTVGFGGIHGWTAVSLDSSPLTSGVAWSDPIGANVSSSGQCASGSTTDKICTQGFVDVSGGGDFTWAFTVTGGSFSTDTSTWHIGGQFADLSDLSSSKGPRGHLISEPGPAHAIPEPGAAFLFAAGLLVVAGRRRTH